MRQNSTGFFASVYFKAVTLGLVAFLLLVSSGPATGSSNGFEAESMKRVSGKVQVKSGVSATNNKVVRLYSGSRLSKSYSSPPVESVTVRAGKGNCRANSYMTLSVNGEKARTWRVQSKSLDSYTANLSGSESGSKVYAIHYRSGKNGKCNGTMRVDSVSLNLASNDSPPPPTPDTDSGTDTGTGTDAGTDGGTDTDTGTDTSAGGLTSGRTCPDSLQSRIDSTPSGGTLEVSGDCIYRETVNITKPMTLDGNGRAEIRGSDVWTSWERSAGGWISEKSLPSFSGGTGISCMKNTSKCRWPAQVFVDGSALEQVASSPGSGQFAVTSGNRVVLGESPGSRVVEVTVRSQWLTGSQKSHNVTIKGFRMKHAANARGKGALTNQSSTSEAFYDGWTISNNVLSDAHTAVVRIAGDDIRLIGNDISRGGQLGIHGDGDGVLVEGNRIHGNNTESFHLGWESGGAKFASYVTDLTVKNNSFYNNRGVGFWCDLYCDRVEISDNSMFRNWGPGIHYEVSTGGIIRNNSVWDNGWKYGQPRAWSPGIVISCSSSTTVSGNTVAWNASGISTIYWNRSDGKCDPVKDVRVQNNTLIMQDGPSLSWIHDGLGTSTSRSSTGIQSSNAGSSNRYWYAERENDSPRFRWVGQNLNNLSSFNRTPGENNGSYISDAQKNFIASGANIPTSPN